MENNFENGYTPNEQAPQQPAWNQQPMAEQPVWEQTAPEQTAWEQPAEQPWDQPPAKSAKKFPTMLVAIAGAAAAILIAAIIVIFSLATNTYKTPVKEVEKIVNMKNAEKMINQAPAVLNGFGEKEAKAILKIMKKSDDWDDMMDEANEAWEETVENLEDEYGKYKIKIKVEDKDKLDKDDCEEFQDMLDEIAEYRDYLKDMDSDDYEEMAEELGVSKSEAKKIVAQAEKFLKKCKSAKVTAGYELDLLVTIDGKDGEDESELTVNVYKVNGRWVLDVFSLVRMFGYYF